MSWIIYNAEDVFWYSIIIVSGVVGLKMAHRLYVGRLKYQSKKVYKLK